MERGIPVSAGKRIVTLLLGAALAAGIPASPVKRELVLVASALAPERKLSIRDIRKLYLGVPVESSGVTVKPLINVSDPLLFEVFLQKITFMSSEAYNKQVLAVVFRLGGERPESYKDRGLLYRALRDHPEAVTFAWSSDLQGVSDVRPVSVLWTGEVD